MENKTKTIYEKLSSIQEEMNVPKNLFNKFGNYYYRNAETILDCAKPLCKKYRTTLIVSDSIELVGDRYYVKAVAELIDWDSEDSLLGIAYAREDENKKGMDGSQITGSSSSYARKYALNGLFNLDDVKDADSEEQANENNARVNGKAVSDKQVKFIESLYTQEEIEIMLQKLNKKSLKNISSEEANKMIAFKRREK